MKTLQTYELLLETNLNLIQLSRFSRVAKSYQAVAAQAVANHLSCDQLSPGLSEQLLTKFDTDISAGTSFTSCHHTNS